MSLTGSSELREAPEAGSGSADGETNNSNESPSLPIPYHLNLPSLSVPYVYRVYQHLREINPAAYEPNLIAIGPYHHGKEKTSMMERIKILYLKSFLGRNNQLSMSKLISLVAKWTYFFQMTYSEHVCISSPELETMIVMDACFIIELALRYRHMVSMRDRLSLLEYHFMFPESMLNYVQRDLVLFENQIPFLIIHEIYNEIKLLGSVPEDLTLPHLLLGLFLGIQSENGYQARTGERDPWMIKTLLHLIHSSWVRPQNDNLNENGENISSWRFISSATDLEEANIRFEKQENSMKSWFDIEFADGILRIPTIVIDDRTESFIRNLMAYEMYRPGMGRNFITDYVVFLHCLINSSADAKLLQSKGIIMNRLGDNEAVASFLKMITVSITLPVPSNFRYNEIFQEINRFQDKKLNRYMAILRRDYFNSPWTISSFVAAVVLLVITFLSTIFTTMQTFKK